MNMNQPINLKSTIPSVKDSISRSPLRRALFVIPLVLACFGPSPAARAVTPAPDGGYGGDNTAEGSNALFSLTTGAWNSAFGSRALYKNATGIRNTAVGYQALYHNNGTFNVSGQDNVALGADALFTNTTGKSNIAIGSFALYGNTTGSNNIAIGDHAFWQNITDSGNTVIGDSFASGPGVVSVGRTPTYDHGGNVTDFGVLCAFINAANDIYIGNQIQIVPMTTYTSRVHIRAQDAVYVGAVYGNGIAGSPVSINSSGQLGVAASSARFKDEIKPMGKASEAILALKPVTFHYKKELDPKVIRQFGLVAEEVEKVNPDLVTCDADGKPYTVRYEAVNAMLLNEFLKEHREVKEQEATITQLKSMVVQQQRDFQATARHQQKRIEALTTGLKKVSDQLEMSKLMPQVVVNNPR